MRMLTFLRPETFFARNARRRSGTIALDVVVGTMLVIPMTFFAIDLTFLLVGGGSNDAACRDASRAAGTADSKPLALTAAVLACSAHLTDGILVTQPHVDDSKFSFAEDPAAPIPYASVVTNCDISLSMLKALAGDGSSSFGLRRRYVFPALSLIQTPPVVQPVAVEELVNADQVGLPDTSGLIAGCGSSDAGNSTE